MIAWFLCDFRIESDPLCKATRVCPIFDFHEAIKLAEGHYDFIETDDNRALVKVVAPPEIVQMIREAGGFTEITSRSEMRRLTSDRPRMPDVVDGKVVYGEGKRPRGATESFDQLDGRVK